MDLFPAFDLPSTPAISAPRVAFTSIGALHADNLYLERQMALRSQQLNALRDTTVQTLVSLASTRDAATGDHMRRSQLYVRTLAQHLRSHAAFAGCLTDESIDILSFSAALHDIGKVGIPDRVLLKPGRLSPDEFAEMKLHTVLGRDALQRAQNTAGLSPGFVENAKEIAYSHHEKWNGTGYPQGLAGVAIPLAARLMALADVYDAMVSRRIYKVEQAHDDVVKVIVSQRGAHFDPVVVDAFLDCLAEFRAISERFSDETLTAEPSAA